MINLTQNQIEKIQFSEGIIYANYGELTEKLLAPTRGGGEFSVVENIRAIEYDGRRGENEMGLDIIESVMASLKVTTLGADQNTLALALCGATLTNNVLTGDTVGLIPSTKYLTNITMFAQLLDGTYKKITLYNALHKTGLTIGAKPKAEGEIPLEFKAHWNPLDTTDPLYKIEDITEFPEVETSI